MNSALAVLESSIERETVAFELHLPHAFLPSDIELGKKTFANYCAHLNTLLGRDNLRHLAVMFVDSGIPPMILHPGADDIIDQHRPESPTTPIKFLRAVLNARSISMRLPPAGSTPQRIQSKDVLLTVYALTVASKALHPNLPPKRLSDMPPEPPLPSALVCDALGIDLDGQTAPTSTVAALHALASWPCPFNAYHIIWGPPGTALEPTVEQLQTARVLTMQFQREWATVDLRRTRELERRAALLLSMNHVSKGALEDTRWREMQQYLSKWEPNDSNSLWLRSALLRSLSHLRWPECLISTVRAFSHAIHFPGHLTRQLLIDPLPPFEGIGEAAAYCATMEHLTSHLLDAFTLLDTNRVLSQIVVYANSTVVKFKSPSADGAPFDDRVLKCPPFSRPAGTSFAAAFLIEPLRNAIRYFVLQQPKDPVLGWSVVPGEECVHVNIFNSLDNVLLFKSKSLELLKEAGEFTGAVTVHYKVRLQSELLQECTVPVRDRPMMVVTVDIHARRMTNVSQPQA